MDTESLGSSGSTKHHLRPGCVIQGGLPLPPPALPFPVLPGGRGASGPPAPGALLAAQDSRWGGQQSGRVSPGPRWIVESLKPLQPWPSFQAPTSYVCPAQAKPARSEPGSGEEDRAGLAEAAAQVLATLRSP